MSDNEFIKVEWNDGSWEPNDDGDANGMPLRPRGVGLSETDLQLLSLAAQAVGTERVEVIEGEQWVNLHCADRPTAFGWDPKLHGDDALNLAADLDIDVLQSATSQEVRAVAPMPRVISEPWGDDKRAATRLAVTRAAAEMAKTGY